MRGLGGADGPRGPGEQQTPPSSTEPLEDPAAQANLIREGLAIALITTSIGKPQIDASGVTAFMEVFIEANGSPTAPLAIMHLQQLAMLHIRVMSLHYASAVANSAEEIKIFVGAAIRSQGEYRKGMVAYRAHRESSDGTATPPKLRRNFLPKNAGAPVSRLRSTEQETRRTD